MNRKSSIPSDFFVKFAAFMTASKMGLLPKTNNWEKPMQAFKITIMLVFLLKAWRWMDLMIECGCG